jgi:hypothetical protein
VQEQVSVINGGHVKDTIWFGFVQGFEEEWGDFSQAELEGLNSGLGASKESTAGVRKEGLE